MYLPYFDGITLRRFVCNCLKLLHGKRGFTVSQFHCEMRSNWNSERNHVRRSPWQQQQSHLIKPCSTEVTTACICIYPISQLFFSMSGELDGCTKLIFMEVVYLATTNVLPKSLWCPIWVGCCRIYRHRKRRLSSNSRKEILKMFRKIGLWVEYQNLMTSRLFRV